MSPFKLMTKIVCYVSLIGLALVAVDGWRTHSRAQARSATGLPNAGSVTDSAVDFGATDFGPAEALAEFQSLLESINAPAQMGAVEPSTELSSGLSEIERESDRLDAMYQSVQEAMHEAVRSSGLSMNPLPEFNLLTPPMSTEEPQR